MLVQSNEPTGDFVKVLIPKRWIPVADMSSTGIVRPLIFLGGPIRGGGDWQHQMCLALHDQPCIENCVIACPCRWDKWEGGHPLAEHFLEGRENFFTDQLDWEEHYLALAGTHKNPGCIIFWLGCESEQYPHPGPEPYAMDTRRELGEWKMRMKLQNGRVVIGADRRFYGLSQIHRSFSRELGYDLPLYETIEATAKAAAKMVIAA